MSQDPQVVELSGNTLTIKDVVNIARNNFPIKINIEAKEKVRKARSLVEEIIEKKQIAYGITTGFGSLYKVVVPPEEIEKLQKNLILSHSCGTGEEISKDIVRATMVLRINSLILGFSGIRMEVLDVLVKFLNTGITPVVYSQGSLGASGDLVPLAHIALTLIGRGEAYYKGEKMPSKEAMTREKIIPVTLREKEGLALINGAQFMTAIGCLAVYDTSLLLEYADLALATSCEAFLGNPSAFSDKIMQVRPHKGQIESARIIRELLVDSEILNSNGKQRVQDPYSFRCAPQVHGASRDVYHFVRKVLTIEVNSATDNPLIFPETGEVISGGNFHGQPIAIALDCLKLAVAELASISERRVNQLMTTPVLKPFLIENSGLNSGYMIPQYVAASLVSENKTLAHPASVDSIPVSANQEDHVSMGSIAARHLAQIISNTFGVLAIEFLCNVQGIDLLDIKSKKAGKGTQIAYKAIREIVPPLLEDREHYIDIRKVKKLLKSGKLLERIQNS